MFGNWINLAEPVRLAQRLRRDPILRQRILAMLHLTSEQRVISSWSHTIGPPVHWWDIPAVQHRVNAMMTGRSEIPYQHYVAEKYLNTSRCHKALSLGCGSSTKEIVWAENGCFEVIDAYDISEARILAARFVERKCGVQANLRCGFQIRLRRLNRQTLSH